MISTYTCLSRTQELTLAKESLSLASLRVQRLKRATARASRASVALDITALASAHTHLRYDGAGKV